MTYRLRSEDHSYAYTRVEILDDGKTFADIPRQLAERHKTDVADVKILAAILCEGGVLQETPHFRALFGDKYDDA